MKCCIIPPSDSISNSLALDRWWYFCGCWPRSTASLQCKESIFFSSVARLCFSFLKSTFSLVKMCRNWEVSNGDLFLFLVLSQRGVLDTAGRKRIGTRGRVLGWVKAAVYTKLLIDLLTFNFGKKIHIYFCLIGCCQLKVHFLANGSCSTEKVSLQWKRKWYLDFFLLNYLFGLLRCIIVMTYLIIWWFNNAEVISASFFSAKFPKLICLMTT